MLVETSWTNGSRPVLLASGIGPGGGIFTLHASGSQLSRWERLAVEPTTGMTSWSQGCRLASVEWIDQDPAPDESTLTLRSSRHERKNLRAGIREPHSLLREGSRLHAVSTAENSILTLNPNGEIIRRWRAPGTGDSWHINSLTVHNGQLAASAFGRFERHREWNEGDNRYGAGIVFEPDTGRTLLSGLSCPHDPNFIDGSWLVCNSAERAVVKLDTEGRELARQELGGWTRGLAADASSLFVGVSAHRLLGDEGKARVVRLERSTLAVVGEWELPCPEVFSLAWVSRKIIDRFAVENACAATADQPHPLAA